MSHINKNFIDGCVRRPVQKLKRQISAAGTDIQPVKKRPVTIPEFEKLEFHGSFLFPAAGS